MQRLAFLLLALCACVPAFAAPFVVGDVESANCTQCVWDGTGFGPLVNDVTVDPVRGKPALGNRLCKRDVGAALIGPNNITVSCRDASGLWADSSPRPLSFAGPPASPRDLRVVP